jgi:hypothetical protein
VSLVSQVPRITMFGIFVYLHGRWKSSCLTFVCLRLRLLLLFVECGDVEKGAA